MDELKIFYRIYQDFEAVSEYSNPDYYVASEDDLRGSMDAWIESNKDDPETGFPLIEPVLMTQEDFDGLLEFQGY